MKPVRLALFIVLLIFHIIVVVLSLRFTPSVADGIARDPSAFRFLALFGLAVFLITFAVVWIDRFTAKKKIERLEAEKDRIKAEVFDREQRARAREQEIEQEIKSFQQSLPEEETTAAIGSTATHDAYPPSEKEVDDPTPPARPRLPDEEVEYAPLKPKQPSETDDSTNADSSRL
jgi:hypothetical protein